MFLVNPKCGVVDIQMYRVLEFFNHMVKANAKRSDVDLACRFCTTEN